MSFFSESRSMAAGEVQNNILAGQEVEFEEFDVWMEAGVVADGAGVELTLVTGPDVIARNRPVSEVNRVPQYPEDFTITDAVGAGQRKILQLRNTAGVARQVRTQVKTTPL